MLMLGRKGKRKTLGDAIIKKRAGRKKERKSCKFVQLMFEDFFFLEWLLYQTRTHTE